MVSICIPIYNFDILELADSLIRQSLANAIQFEIIFIDDASDEHFKTINSDISANKNVVYIELVSNIGRSAIRNLFLQHAKYENLLFLDCDSKIEHDQFIFNYLKQIGENASVVCGGRKYESCPKDRALKLRWKYGVKRECLPSEKRLIHPYHSFMSNNFLIRKEVFEKIKFDEGIQGYGHEDTLFGYRLKQNGVNIIHLDNSVIHQFDESATVFIKKTRDAIRNLYFIYSKIEIESDFMQMVKLLKTFNWLERHKLIGIMNLIYRLTSVCVLKSLKTRFICLFLLDLYKLGFLCHLAFLDKHKNN